jgi:hypothetical protein
VDCDHSLDETTFLLVVSPSTKFFSQLYVEKVHTWMFNLICQHRAKECFPGIFYNMTTESPPSVAWDLEGWYSLASDTRNW